jgi:hypothetical protein
MLTFSTSIEPFLKSGGNAQETPGLHSNHGSC